MAAISPALSGRRRWVHARHTYYLGHSAGRWPRFVADGFVQPWFYKVANFASRIRRDSRRQAQRCCNLYVPSHLPRSASVDVVLSGLGSLTKALESSMGSIRRVFSGRALISEHRHTHTHCYVLITAAWPLIQGGNNCCIPQVGEPWKCACRRACQAGEVPSFLPHLMSTRIKYQRTGSAVLMRPVCIGGKLTRQERPFCHSAAWEASRRAHFPGSTPHATQEPAASWEGASHFHEQDAQSQPRMGRRWAGRRAWMLWNAPARGRVQLHLTLLLHLTRPFCP